MILITDELTTIQLKKSTRELLREIGKKSETYDSVVLRLIGYYQQKEKVDQ